ncbi:MAG: hypothetical protein L0221_19445, partial [Chloroflexi bacterium]|nr:hypothetical protein [Chloroflexota bacterium]
AAFCVVGQGDDGGTTKVVIPSDFDVEITGGDGGELRRTGTGGQAGASSTTYSTGRLARPYEFWACLNATNVAGFEKQLFFSPSGRSIVIEAWPEDPTWGADVRGDIDGILAELEALLGRPLPTKNGQIVIREAAFGELGGYAGFFNSVTGIIRIGEDLGQGDVLAHELSHAWFNNFTFLDVWMAEGLAEWARISTIQDDCPDPGDHPGDDAPNIDEWVYVGPRSSEDEFAVVDYEYAAACFIVATLASMSGPDRTRDAIAALLDSELAYRSGETVLTRPKFKATWRHFIDAFDELGLVPAGEADLDFAQDLLGAFGIAENDATARLVDRSTARAAYHRLIADVGDWTIPEVILRSMSDWAFVSALKHIEQGAAIHAAADQANATLPGLDALNGPVRGLFEQARSADDLA